MPQRTSRQPRLADVAAAAGVDVSVVSRVVNNDPALSIRDVTRTRVQQAISELGYRPNAAARSLRTARAGTLAFVIPDYHNPIYAEIIRGAEIAATRHGYMLVTATPGATSVTDSTYLDLLGNGRVDGVLLAGGSVSKADRAELTATGMPWLQVNRRSTGSTRYVVLDDAGGAALAVQHLLDLGHTRIGHVGGLPGVDTARRRRLGWSRALVAAGIDPTGLPLVRADYTPEGGRDALYALAESAELPTAVVVANVASAIGVLHAAAELGIHVPDQLSVVAIHDMALASFLVPSLTTVRMPLPELAARAVDLLLNAPATDKITATVAEPMELVRRRSSGPAPRVRHR